MPTLAEAGLCIAAKDISQGGIIGTCALFAESSRVGITLDIDSIQKPSDYPLEDWLCTFPSFGYVMAVKSEHIEALTEHFTRNGISANVIGSIDDMQTLAIRRGDRRELVRDLNLEPLTGCASETTSVMPV